ncbi:MAG: [FeFe] hydrogenase H-cluster radical SAM maturase HydE [bacterium]
MMKQAEILHWLKEKDPTQLRLLYAEADRIREKHVGNAIHFRGLIEFSNICHRSCWYCGIRYQNAHIERYRMSRQQILDAARRAVELNFGTIVLQSGEDPDLDTDDFCQTIRTIKKETNLAITLSVGERSFDELAKFKIAGADRYLLRFETSNTELYRKIHPPLPSRPNYDRFEILLQLNELGYEVGSGIMVGIPGSTWDDILEDLHLFQTLPIDMIGIGPYIPHPSTPLAKVAGEDSSDENQPPNTSETALKVLALTRILCPDTNLPSTTALETSDPEKGYENGLLCGANVIMPNITDMHYRKLYDIYPGKAGQARPAKDLLERIHKSLEHIGRVPGTGPGLAPRFVHRTFER